MLHGNRNYNVGNVHAYPQQIGTGWGGGGGQTFVYNGTILMRDAQDQWCNELLTRVTNNSIFTPPRQAEGHWESGTCCAPACPAIPCPPGPPARGRCSGGGNSLTAGGMTDEDVTARAKSVLAPYPRPVQYNVKTDDAVPAVPIGVEASPLLHVTDVVTLAASLAPGATLVLLGQGDTVILHCDSVTLSVIDCHSSGIYKIILLSWLPFAFQNDSVAFG
jgi:hypothetical protein